MTWWVLTALNHYPACCHLRITASSSQPDFLYVAWAYHKPSRHPVYRTIRGKRVLCGFTYIWDTPHIHSQAEAGDVINHSWLLTNLRPHSTIWYYLFAPDGPYGLEIQGPLMHATLEWPMPPAARIYRNTAQVIPFGILTFIDFEAQHFDTDNMWTAAPNPSRLTINTAGMYLCTAGGRWQPLTGGRRLMRIMLNHTIELRRHEIGSPALLPSETSQVVNTIWDCAAGDFFELEVVHTKPGNLNLGGVLPNNPILSAIRIGP